MSIIDYVNEKRKKTYNLQFFTNNIAEIYQIFSEIRRKYAKRTNFEKISLHIKIEYIDEV